MAIESLRAFLRSLRRTELSGEQFLRETAPVHRLDDHSVDELDVDADGWQFFRLVPETRDTLPSCEVIGPDGSRVTDEEASALGDVYRAMGVLDAEAPPVREMVEAARALLAGATDPVVPERVERIQQRYEDHAVEAPQCDRTDDGLELRFWATSGGKRPGLSRYEMTVGPGYDIEWDGETAERRE